jgi:hypothetical protein
MKRIKRNYWNFRIGTKLINSQEGHDLDTGKITKFPDERVFTVIEVYYKNGKPNGYAERANILQDLNSIKEIKWVRKKIKRALNRSILDLNNFPNKWKDKNV